VATEKRQRQDQRRVEKLKEQEVLTTKQAAVKKRKRFLWFLIPGVLVVAGVLFFGGRGSDDNVATDTGATTTVPGVTTTTLLPVIAKKPPFDAAIGTGAAPTKLEKKDLVTGTGPEIVKGADVKINKIAKVWESKKEIDSTWGATPNLYEVKGVGNGVIMAGLDEGLIGMKQGGRRQITIPAAKAFGTKGSTSLGVKPGESLVYIVDAVEVIPPTK
jgi:peptidylprolyl isomerase